MATIICGTDGSAGAGEALRVARELSAELQVRLVLAHVAAGVGSAAGAEGVTGARAREGASRLLNRLAREHAVDPETAHRIELGEPAEGLARIAAEEGGTIIVVGSRRRGRRGRKLVSGLAGELAASAPCPVVVVPPPARG